MAKLLHGMKRNLGRHLQIMGGIQKFECTDFDKTFSCRDGFIIHMDTHMAEEPPKQIDTHLDVDKTDEQEVKIQLPLKLTNINLFYLT